MQCARVRIDSGARIGMGASGFIELPLNALGAHERARERSRGILSFCAARTRVHTH